MAAELQLRWDMNGRLWGRILGTFDPTKSQWIPVGLMSVKDERTGNTMGLYGPSLDTLEPSSGGHTAIRLRGLIDPQSPPPKSAT
jgi:hypothetical protein